MSDLLYLLLTLVSFVALALLTGYVDRRPDGDPDGDLDGDLDEAAEAPSGARERVGAGR